MSSGPQHSRFCRQGHDKYALGMGLYGRCLECELSLRCLGDSHATLKHIPATSGEAIPKPAVPCACGHPHSDMVESELL